MKLSFLIIAASISTGSMAYASPTTKYAEINQSLEELLNSGWEPINFYGATYLLKKSGKYAVCTVSNNGDRHSSDCHALN